MSNLIRIRKFTEKDIENKIKWINDRNNNKFLHYDLPLEYEKTVLWYNNNNNRRDRYDAVIEYDNIPVGIIGLLNIDEKNQKAEYYITIGETGYKGKGIGYEASRQILDYAFNEMNLNKIYLYTEVLNIPAQSLFEKLNFKKEGTLMSDLIYNSREVDRFVYGIRKCEFKESNI